MRILWSIHLYPPAHNCGAEYVAHHVNKFLIEHGHQVRVMLLQYKGNPYTFEGVEVMPYVNSLDAYRWADVVFTHLDYTQHTMNMCYALKIPVVHFMHNDSVEYYKFIDEAILPQYMVYNSYWMQLRYSFKQPGMVLQPPCPADYYRILGNPIENEYITLINTNENKGGYILYRLAEAMPHRKFLAVNGSYDDGGLMPDINAKLKSLPNVKFVDHSPNVREIYQQTRVLLVLSRYESWGRVATEAMSNGIPIIYTPTPGLLENVNFAGIQVEPRGKKVVDPQTYRITEHDGNTYDISGIVEQLNRLDETPYYTRYSKGSLERYKYLSTLQNTQLNGLLHIINRAKRDFELIRYTRGQSSVVTFTR